MKQVITSEPLPIKLWLDDIEAGAMQQARNLANLPFAFRHIAIMPDCHLGYGMPIGGVLAAQDVIIPNAVGVDIGCGMCALRTSLTEIERSQLLRLVEKIRQEIPVGFEWHKQVQADALMPKQNEPDRLPVVRREYEKARQQIGTLGGGNHFIEIQRGSDGFIWIMIHSGSRNIGKMVADHYNSVAQQASARYFPQIPRAWQLAALPMETPEALCYQAEMEYCIAFALANRHSMMKQVQTFFTQLFPNIQYDQILNIAHNYAAQEHHFGHDVIVHRKGATSARAGELGIIPGSQGTQSYLVRGKGNPESFNSCSHGAGRRMGRKQAIRELSLEREQALLRRQGIIHSIKKTADLDEAPSAYKDIDTVMANQADLVEIVTELSPLAVIKG